MKATMKKGLTNARRYFALAGVSWVLMATAQYREQQPAAPLTRDSNALVRFLRDFLSDPQLGPDKTTKIQSASVQIGPNSTAKEVLVYVSGQRWCGSGGCTLLILEPNDSSFNVIGRISIVQLPIRVLASATSGRPDIEVRVQGGGIEQGYEALLRFDGEKYPSNPTVPPAGRLHREVTGEKVISTAENSKPLYE